MEDVIIRERINDDYEYIQYNRKLRLIHSVTDDMYQMRSILVALGCEKKRASDWFANQSTQQLLQSFTNEREFPLIGKPYENRENLTPKISGYYVHRLLVNAVAMWASPEYAMTIFIMLDKIAEDERNQLQFKLTEQEKLLRAKDKALERANRVISNQDIELMEREEIIDHKDRKITNQRPRLVAEGTERTYKYLITIDDDPNDPTKVVLTSVRRSNKMFERVEYLLDDPDHCWFYRENLPVVVSANLKIKDIIIDIVGVENCKFWYNNMTVPRDRLPEIHAAITRFFDTYQE